MPVSQNEVPLKLTRAQQRELLTVLRVHPAFYRSAKYQLADRLCVAGMLWQTQRPPNAAYQLTPAGVDVAARLSAQQVIDAVNAVN